MSFHLLSGTVRANLISLACFRARSATVFPSCPFIGKPFLHSGNIYHHRFFCEVHNLLSYFCKKYICRSFQSFVLSAFNFKSMIHAKSFQVKLSLDDRVNYSFSIIRKFFKPGLKLKWENPHSRSLSALNH